MTIMRDWPANHPGLTGTIEWRARRALLPLMGAVAETLRLWRARSRERRELAGLSARDLRDMRAPRCMVIEESRKWPWQA